MAKKRLIARLGRTSCVVLDVRVVLPDDRQSTESLERALEELRSHGMAEVMQEGTLNASIETVELKDLPLIEFEEG